MAWRMLAFRDFLIPTPIFYLYNLGKERDHFILTILKNNEF